MKYILKVYTMKSLSLKIEEILFSETEELLSYINKPRNRYINEAISYYNKIQKRKILQEQLQKESEIVREDSMNVLAEFESVEYEG